ncbi:MAG: right-handed parallel beta-helix repeat-containing protein [Candidatus Bipolaricaulaceae bacterium]
MRPARKALLLGLLGCLGFLFGGCGSPRSGGPAVREVRPGQSIQAAIDQARPGETIVLARGTWSENLRIEKSLILRGAGPEATVLRAAHPGPPLVWICGDAEVTLEGLTLQEARGGYLHPQLSSAGAFAQDRARVTLQRVRLQNHAASGVFARDQAHVALRDAVISGNARYGLELVGRAQAVLERVRVEGNKLGGIWLAEEAALEGEDLRLQGNLGPGVWARDAAALRLFTGELRENATNAVRLQDRSTAVLTAVQILQHPESGVHVADQAELRGYGALWEGNWHGVEIAGGLVQLERCGIRASRWDGVRAQGGRVEVQGSWLEGGRGAGLNAFGTAQAALWDSAIRGFSVAGVSGFSAHPVQGRGNVLAANGVDLVGRVDPQLRQPRAVAERPWRRLEGPEEDLQGVVDGLLPGGVLELAPGRYPGGLTVDKPLEIRGEGAVLVGQEGAPVISVVAGGELRLVGVGLQGGGEGLAVGAGARAELVACELRDNTAGIRVWQDGWLRVQGGRIAHHPQGGLWLWDQAQAELEETTLRENGVCGIGVAGRSRLVLRRCVLAENGWQGGLLLRDRAEVELYENLFVNNYGYGIAVQDRVCLGSGPGFGGSLQGAGNVFEGNYKGPACPAALALRVSG